MTTDTDKFRFTRFTKVYPSRGRAIEKLNNTSRYYAEMVAIKYKSGSSFDILLALYHGEEKGNYTLVYDSASRYQSVGKTYKIKKLKEETDKESIARAMIDEPVERDIIIIESSSGIKSAYIFYNGVWESLSKGITTENTETIKLSLSEEGILSADIKEIDCGYL